MNNTHDSLIQICIDEEDYTEAMEMICGGTQRDAMVIPMDQIHFLQMTTV